jgi:sialate O-acetylesterase
LKYSLIFEFNLLPLPSTLSFCIVIMLCTKFMKKRYLSFAFAALALAACEQAPLTMPAVFSDNMVLQQQSTVPIWGKATPNKIVDVTPSWGGNTYGTKADADGNWKTALPTPEAGGPYTVIVSSGAASDTLKNVMIGEVWLCSGQSNMEMPLAGWGKVQNYEEEIANANYPNIRLFQVENACNTQPQRNLAVRAGGWQICSPATVADFSSIGYFFGRDIQQSLGGIPIGIIDATWGGTVVEAWTSAGALKTQSEFVDAVKKIESTDNDKLIADYERTFGEWHTNFAAADKGIADGKAVWAAADFDDSGWKTMPLPDRWEDKGLPDFDGVVWYRLEIDVPETWMGKDLTLSLAEIDDNDITYFNGEQVGATDGYDQFRKYTIPARLVKKGKNIIAVRIMDTGSGGGFHGIAKEFYLSLSDKVKIPLAGRWKYQPSLDVKKLPPAPPSPAEPNRPTVLYNAMIAPLVPFTIRGALWYQGESNADRPQQYRTLFPLMINDWRKQWGYEFAFYFVQLAGYDAGSGGNWSLLREAQTQALALPNTGMAVAFDIGNDKDIHPKNKQEAAHRLALWAKAKTYGIGMPSYSGPLYKNNNISGGKVRIAFDHADGGLNPCNKSSLGGFVIAGADGKFHDAQTKIDGNEVVVWSPNVAAPTTVRYGWTDTQGNANLCNGDYLPASPFRTDRD